MRLFAWVCFLRELIPKSERVDAQDELPGLPASSGRDARRKVGLGPIAIEDGTWTANHDRKETPGETVAASTECIIGYSILETI